MKLLVLYVFHEYHNRVQYFIDHAVFEDPEVDFLFISNQPNKIHVPSYVTVLYRKNVGYDFGGWSDGLLRDDKYTKYTHFIFANSSIVGPYRSGKWTDVFIHGLSDTVRLFGCTINPMVGMKQTWAHPHVQSYLFSMTRETVEYLIQAGLFSRAYVKTFQDAIIHKEIHMSTLILQHWDIGCLMPCYAFVSFREEPILSLYNDPMLKWAMDAKLWTREDLVFVKGNRDIPIITS